MANASRTVSIRDERGALILTIEVERISSYEIAETMGRELVQAISGRAAPRVIVDMHKLGYMSSVGYGPLISFRSRVREAGGKLVLCGLSGVVKETFEATRLLINPQSPQSLFQFTDGLETAIAAVSQP